MDYSARFYSTPAANQLYYNYVKQIINRTNSVNGIPYANDPTIMAWKLANEPRPGRDGDPGKKNLPVYYAWIENSARYIHSLDTNHLVSTGNEGLAGSLQMPEAYIEAHKTPGIDYVTMHLWPLNWGWFNPKKIPETLPSSERNALYYIQQHFGYARQLNKPIVLEEFGIGRDEGDILPGTPTTARDHYYNVIFSALYDSARAGAPIAGFNFWTWGGEGKALHSDGVWVAGDSFMGDPPQEPQGRNSIFTADSSTMNIIGMYSQKLKGLRIADSASDTSR
jgi:mannan endo-1,4-beta-mannosidase